MDLNCPNTTPNNQVPTRVAIISPSILQTYNDCYQ